MNNHNQSMVTPTDPTNEDVHLGGNLLHGDAMSYSPMVMDYVINRFCIRSVLDIGAGMGDFAHFIHKKYHIPVIGFDGLKSNVRSAYYPLVLHDLTKAPFICPVDLVCCVELVEHIEEKFIGNLLASFRNGRIVLLTHALPGQGGYHHVNEQTGEYWIKALESIGYGLLESDSVRVRTMASNEIHGASWFAQSGLLFVRMESKPQGER